MDEILKCCSCGTKFETTGPKEPQVLPCQHTFCKVCIFKLVRTDSTKCPTCREVHPAITAANRNPIRTNLTIIRLLEEVPVSVSEVPVQKHENGTVYRTNVKLEMLKIYIVHVILTLTYCVIVLPDCNLRKPTLLIAHMIGPFYHVVLWLKNLDQSSKYITNGSIHLVNAIGIVAILNFILPIMKQLAIRFLKAPVWKGCLLVFCSAILIHYFPSQTKI